MSGISLKAFIPVIAKVVDMTPAALYERQRALVRAGLLHSEGGRGPGSGVRATPESMAMLLISLLATGSLSDTETQTKIVASLKSKTKHCPLTGKKTFASALTAVLASEDTAKRARWLELERGGSKSGASLFYYPRAIDVLSDRDHPVASEFGFVGAHRKAALSVQATLTLPLHAIAHTLKEINK
jgi:DNA-binding IscR family transcriptional regulator